MKIVIEPVNPDGKRQEPDHAAQTTEIELTLRRIDGSGIPLFVSDLCEEQLDVLDPEGRVWTPSPWRLSDLRPKQQGEELRVRLIPVDQNLSAWSGELAGAKLRYHEMIVAKVDVPFEFSNLDMA